MHATNERDKQRVEQRIKITSSFDITIAGNASIIPPSLDLVRAHCRPLHLCCRTRKGISHVGFWHLIFCEGLGSAQSWL